MCIELKLTIQYQLNFRFLKKNYFQSGWRIIHKKNKIK